MSKHIDFKLNKAGVRELLRSSQMLSVCKQYAQTVQSKCGDGYEVTTHTGKNRVNASVHAGTVEARRDNLDNNTLEKAVRK